MGRTSDARERLIAATIDLIWMESYGAVTVDAICERAGVKKGSFYHFFKSKEDLVVAALEAHWQSRRPTLDHLFSPSLAPLERLRGYFASVYTRQRELQAAKGRTLGCLFNSVGVTCGQQEQPAISRKVQEILAIYLGYYENALRDAKARGEIRADDVPGTARALFALMEGVLAQARIQNDPELVRPLASLALQFLGVDEGARLVAPETPVP
ncbi:MAG TPA: TetR/AcrR family transcriptional regulator [Polyangia bacterium]|jgi:TetR/AcrR family transcriptional repressor of nem operon|nr:TetR/AcrR family transcriptional regulator [Polyangia bacterium]